MSRCQHYDGGSCVVCDDPVNSCCKDDKICYDCDNEICYDCYDARNGECPVCNLEIVTDSQLLKFLLTKLNLSKNQAIENFITEQKKKTKKVVYRKKT